MSLKKVKFLLPAEPIDMDGVILKQALPTQKVEQVDPFLLLHHGQIEPFYDRPARIQGVAPHPHRGFSPVTFVIEGEVRHRDSRGNDQIAHSGDVQWLHAGAGIMHSERPTEELLERKGIQEIIQLWINSPAAKKMLQPDYQYVPKEQMPIIEWDADGISSKLVAGKYGNYQGPIRTQSPLLVMWSTGRKDGQCTFHIPEGWSSAIYLIKGNISIGGFGMIDPENMVVFETDGAEIEVKSNDDSQFLLLAGAPIKEKMVHNGPFVMNTETEILEAMRDYRMGKMGILIED